MTTTSPLPFDFQAHPRPHRYTSIPSPTPRAVERCHVPLIHSCRASRRAQHEHGVASEASARDHPLIAAPTRWPWQEVVKGSATTICQSETTKTKPARRPRLLSYGYENSSSSRSNVGLAHAASAIRRHPPMQRHSHPSPSPLRILHMQRSANVRKRDVGLRRDRLTVCLRLPICFHAHRILLSHLLANIHC